ncbi:MAG: MBL fold metallo-hydrolase [Bacteroidales bacterium]|nr:MBL fold metallo-hydrolase [Bacteroidales bacterium]
MKKIILMSLIATIFASCNNSQQTSNQNQPQEQGKDYSKIQFLNSKEKQFDDFSLYWLKDNLDDKLFPTNLFSDASDSLIEALNLKQGLKTTMSAFLIKSNGKYILFDSGNGENANGQLINNLASLNLTPDSINYVFLTHFHGDHIGGMLNKEGEIVFKNAEIYSSKLEYESAKTQNNAQAVEMINKYQNQFKTFEFGDTLPENIIAIEAIGHTAGHTVYQKSNLLIIGDLLHAIELQIPHPEVCANFDADKSNSKNSRKKILDYALENNLITCGMHLIVE